MSILDQLKQEAAARQQHKQAQENLEQQREQRYKKVVLPAMHGVFGFMQELVEQLNILEHAIVVDTYSDKYPQLGRLIQKDYKLYTDDFGGFADFDRLMQVNVRFFCSGNGAFSYNLESQGRIEREVAFLTASRVNFDWKYQGNNAYMQSACFTFTRKIPVRFKFEVDYSQGKIRLQINNHDNFMAYSKLFDPEEVNEGLLDEVARFMLRKDCDFIRLEISHDNRKAIQQLVEDQRRETLAIQEQIRFEEISTLSAESKSVSKHLKKLTGFIKKK